MESFGGVDAGFGAEGMFAAACGRGNLKGPRVFGAIYVMLIVGGDGLLYLPWLQ